MKPRPYQSDCLRAIEEASGEARSVLVVLATGLGKTVIMAARTKTHLARGQRALMLAHRKELVEQGARTIERFCGVPVDIEMADRTARHDLFNRAPVVSASKDSLRSRLGRYDPQRYGLLLTDEAHHATARSYRVIYDHFHTNPDLLHLGVTATPDRADEEALGQIFEAAPFSMGILEGITGGWLVPVRQKYVLVKSLDFDGIGTTAGDLNAGELARTMEYEQTLHEMVVPTVEFSGERRCLVFATRRHHAERIAEIIRRHGRSAETVDGTTAPEERAATFARFSRGDTQYLVNVGIATEGWDDPAEDGRGVSVIAIMRPTKSRSLYAQMVGRGTRTLPGTIAGLDDAPDAARRAAIAASAKPHVTVLDFVGNSTRHKLVHMTDILDGKVSDAVLEHIERETDPSKGGGTEEEFDVLEEMDRLERVYEERQAEKRRRAIRARADWEAKDIDPFDVVGITPRRVPGWLARKPPSEKQLDLLRRNGVPVERVRNVGEASQLIDAVLSRPSPKQRQLLARTYPKLDVDSLNRKQASALIDATAGHGWKPIPDPIGLLGGVK